VAILWLKLNIDNIYQLLGNQKHKDVVNLMDNLKNGITAQEYKNKLEDILETLPDAENQNVETAWENIKQAICKAAENILGYNVKKIRNGWYDEECKEVLEVQNCACLNILWRKMRGNIQTYKDA
jgi:hypothetical protein